MIRGERRVSGASLTRHSDSDARTARSRRCVPGNISGRLKTAVLTGGLPDCAACSDILRRLSRWLLR